MTSEPTIEQVRTMLAGTPPRLAELVAGLTPVELTTRPAPDEWSANDVLAHLRACADMWGGSITTMLREDHPTIRAVNPTTWINDTDYPGRAFRPSLRAYTRQRDELLALLEPLPPDGWARGATFTGAGAPIERTVLFQARRIVRHERPHLKQVARLADRDACVRGSRTELRER
jgi:DinB superfamily